MRFLDPLRRLERDADDLERQGYLELAEELRRAIAAQRHQTDAGVAR